MSKLITCQNCHGVGTQGDPPAECEQCGGTGQISNDRLGDAIAALADCTEQLSDILDKCNDIFEKANEIKEVCDDILTAVQA